MKNVDCYRRAAIRADFRNSTGSFSGAWTLGRDMYRVYSYETVIAEFTPGKMGRGTWWVTDERYSSTTTRHCNGLRTAIANCKH